MEALVLPPEKDCRNCDCATIKRDPFSRKNYMYCETEDSVIMLRDKWGPREIPGWCPMKKKEGQE